MSGTAREARRGGDGWASRLSAGIDRFWKAGHGWVLARDLKPGAAFRALVGRCFFADKAAAPVHDNTLVAPTPEPSDAPPESTRAE
jgi:hypothetical protein